MEPGFILFAIFFYFLLKVVSEAVTADINGAIYGAQEGERRFPKRVIVTPTEKWYSLDTYGNFYSDDYRTMSDEEGNEMAKRPGNKMLGFMKKDLYQAYLKEKNN